MFLELSELFGRASALDLAGAGRPGFDYPLESLRRALDRGLPLRMHARRADEIRRALASGRGRRVLISGATEAHLAANELRGTPVVLELTGEAGRIGQNRDVAREPLEATLATAAVLDHSGVRFALAAEDSGALRDLLFVAGMAVGGGLKPARALAALTADAAAILGVSERVGSLTASHDADFVVLTGEPFAATTSVRAVYVDGVLRYEARPSEATVLSAGHIVTLEGPDLERGALLMGGGKIAAIGATVASPAGARVESFGADAWVVPGFLDALGHLGLRGDRARADADLPIQRVRAAEDEATLEVARAGITTTIVAPYAAGDRGARMAALKTAGLGAGAIVVEPTCGLLFPAAEGDILELKDRYKSALDQGKAYFDKWQKYAEELKKWEEEQKQGTAPRKETKPADDQAKKESRTDAISGKWEGTVAGGGQNPEPQKLTMYLRLDGNRITGKTTSPMRRRNVETSGEVGLSGTLDGDRITLELEPMGGGRRGGRGGGAPRIEAKLDKPDHMVGTFGFGNFTRDLEATRVEKGAFDVLVVNPRRKKVEDNRPQPPPVDEKLEPYRALFAKRIPAVVAAAGALEIRALVKLFAEEYSVPLVLVAPAELWRVQDEVRRLGVAVIAPTTLFATRDHREINVPAELVASGAAVAFQSDAENAAQDLPALVAFAVHSGLDPTAALKAITINPAKAYHIDDRVGSLRVGKDADVLVFSGPPLDLRSRLLRVYVGGREVYRLPAE
ncbi:MAG: amidohydrolase family protein [Planctomycetota bacterium]